MAITDNLLVHVKPQAGDTFIKNRVDDSDAAASGAGSITLVDDSGLYGWNVQGSRTGTFAGGAGYEGGAITLAIRFKCVSRGANFSEYFVARGAGGTGFGPRISNAGTSTGAIRAREILAAGTTTEVGLPSYTTGNYITIVLKCVDSSFGDGLHAFWLGQVGRVGDAPDATAAAQTGTRDTALAYLAWGLAGENVTFTDVLLWQRGLTDAEAAAVADDIGNAIPSGGGSPPAGTVTITGATPTSDGASVAFTYDAADQTGFEYRIDGGTPASAGTTSPLVIAGQSPGTYDVEIRAVNADGEGAWSDPEEYTVPTNDAPTFDGTDIGDQAGTEGVALTPLDVSGLFSDTDALTFSAIGTWPAGVTVSSAGVISGTPTTAGTYSSLQVRATDTAAQTADSDSFTFTIAAATGTIDLSDSQFTFKTNNGTVLASLNVTFWIHDATTGALVANIAGSTDASGIAGALTDADIDDSTNYRVDWLFDTGEFGCGFFTSEA